MAARKKKVRRGIPSQPPPKAKKPASTKKTNKDNKYRPAILDFSPVFDVPTSSPTLPTMTSIITSNQQQRQNGGGLLIRAGNSWRSDDPRIDVQLQAALIDIGVQLASLTPLGVRTVVQASSDSNYHLSWANDPLNDGGFLITLSTPTDIDITGGIGSTITGAHASTLSPGAAATASIDSSGIIQIGVPRGDDGSNGLSAFIANGTVTNHTGSLTLTLDGPTDPISIGATSITYYLNGNIPPGPTGSKGDKGDTGLTGSTGSSGVISVANVDQDHTLPDTLVYDSSTKIVTLKRPGNGFDPTPVNTGCTICDLSETIAAYVNSKFVDEVNAQAAHAGAGLGIFDFINLFISTVPEIGQVTDAIMTMVTDIQTTGTATIIASNSTDARAFIAEQLYCVMSKANTTTYSQDVQLAWSTLVHDAPTTNLAAPFALLYAMFINAFPVGGVLLAAKFSSTGHDCAAYDCGGGTSTGTWCHVYDFTTSTNGFVGWDLEGNGSPGTWISGAGWVGTSNADRNYYGDFQGDLPATLHVTSVELIGVGQANRGGVIGARTTGPGSAETTAAVGAPGAGSFAITQDINDVGNHLQVYLEVAHGSGPVAKISSIILRGTGDYPTSFNNC